MAGVVATTPAAAQTAAAAGSLSAVSTADPTRELVDEISALRADFDDVRRQYDERLAALEQRLDALRDELAVAPVPVDPDPAASMPPGEPESPSPVDVLAPAGPQLPAASSTNAFNPDISVIGNFLGAAGRNPNGEDASLALTEAEVSFQAVVDPYARADFYLGASSEGLDIEEGAITFTTLPANLLVRVGKLKAQFGKVNLQHTHQLPYVDRPLVITNLVGGEEGLADSGISVSHLIQNPHLFLEVTGELYRGDSEVFQSDARSRLAYVGHLRAYRDLTEATNLDLGASIAYGPTDVDPGPDAEGVLGKTMYGVDATFRYRPLRQAIYKRLNVRSELVWARQELPFGQRHTAFGAYGMAEYQMARRWYVGGRLDRSARLLEPDLVDTGGAVFVTYWPTEFSQIRGQFRRIDYGDGANGNEAFLQFSFAIGAHGAHVF